MRVPARRIGPALDVVTESAGAMDADDFTTAFVITAHEAKSSASSNVALGRETGSSGHILLAARPNTGDREGGGVEGRR